MKQTSDEDLNEIKILLSQQVTRLRALEDGLDYISKRVETRITSQRSDIKILQQKLRQTNYQLNLLKQKSSIPIVFYTILLFVNCYLFFKVYQTLQLALST